MSDCEGHGMLADRGDVSGCNSFTNQWQWKDNEVRIFIEWFVHQILSNPMIITFKNLLIIKFNTTFSQFYILTKLQCIKWFI